MKKMSQAFKALFAVCIVCALIIAGTIIYAAKPAQNISAKRHPNLLAAQRLTMQAYENLTAAQKAGKFDPSGHVLKAKGLLDQANAELKLAEAEVNSNP